MQMWGGQSCPGAPSGDAFQAARRLKRPAAARIGYPTGSQPSRRKGASHRRGWSAPFVAVADYWTTYWTTTVAALAPNWDFTVPTVTTTGWGVPVGAVAGIVTLTCMTPEISPAAEPAYSTGASTPPMVTVTGRRS